MAHLHTHSSRSVCVGRSLGGGLGARGGEVGGYVHTLTTVTCFLNCWHSSGVSVSALAISGMTFTFSCNRFMNSMSRGFSLQPDTRPVS